VDDDLTLRANREAMAHYQLRARRLMGVARADLKTEVFGASWDMPIYVSAVGSQRAFHPEGEMATARAAKAQKTVQMLSSVTSTRLEEVAKALDTPPWYQMYMPTAWADTELMVKRVESAGSPVLVWTIDTLNGRNTETATRAAFADKRDCMGCHVANPRTRFNAERSTGDGTDPNLARRNSNRPMFQGLSSGAFNPPAGDWSYVDRLRKMTKMKLLLKGIDTGEDAKLALEHGVDGVIVSNHGGRATETGRGTMDILPEVVDAVHGQIPVFVDGGFRRGSDVLKALAIGARAVGIGRPYIWGLAAYGQEGVERVLEILRAELNLTMRQCGIASVGQITRAAVLREGAKL
jgi:isopentenyl diphosphate isomerase/L-lactate dehydrogenase-like FMN-dependent dehydrogenase